MPVAPTVEVGLPQAQGTAGITVSAPMGGMNNVSPAGAMPPSDCLILHNLIPFQYGLRLRSGSTDWYTGIRHVTPEGDTLFSKVRSIIPFTGSAENGSRDRLFACTQEGIFDVSEKASGYTHSPVYTFPAQTIRSGTGVATAFVNLAGDHYLAYCDGSNGYLLYSEKTDTWTKVVEGTADGQISGANPDSFRFVMQWKNRLWFVEGNSAKSYYLDIRSFAGEAHELNFAPRFKNGGSLVGLWSLTRDGGDGIDDLLVGISRGGDVVVYQGTDPAFAETFGLKGVYWIGPVPPGRQIASDFGGDLFVLSQAGCLPLSRLMAGGAIRDPNIYETAKITNLFARLMSERVNSEGWAVCQHPNDNLLVVNVPGAPGGDPEQLVMSLATKGWARVSGLPMTCLATWRGKLYFGTADGRICVNEGSSDSGLSPTVTGDPEVWTYTDGGPQAIDFALLSSYSSLGTPRFKMVHMARPYFITDGTEPGYSVEARFDYDLANADLESLTPVTTTIPAWDTAVWDSSTWGSGSGTAGQAVGTTGIGVALAYLLRGSTTSPMTFVSMDLWIEQGGLL